MNLSQAQQNANFFDENYITLMTKLKTEDIKNGDKIFIGSKENRHCRFCGKGKGDTTFKKIAHAVPELIGNKVLISYEECDKCNKLFSNYENELANFLSFKRSTSGIKGKKGVPTYKEKSGLKIEHDKVIPNRFIVQDIIDSENIEEDNENKTFTIKGESSPYIPLSVYKCFVKMALSIMPKNYLHKFFETLVWIQEDDFPYPNPCMIFEQFIPGPRPYNEIEMYLMLRKDESVVKTPYCIFVICFGNYSYQVFLPLADPDSITDNLEEKYTYRAFPSRYAFGNSNGEVQTGYKDFSLNTRVPGENIDITYSYEEKIILKEREEE